MGLGKGSTSGARQPYRATDARIPIACGKNASLGSLTWTLRAGYCPWTDPRCLGPALDAVHGLWGVEETRDCAVDNFCGSMTFVTSCGAILEARRERLATNPRVPG